MQNSSPGSKICMDQFLVKTHQCIQYCEFHVDHLETLCPDTSRPGEAIKHSHKYWEIPDLRQPQSPRRRRISVVTTGVCRTSLKLAHHLLQKTQELGSSHKAPNKPLTRTNKPSNTTRHQVRSPHPQQPIDEGKGTIGTRTLSTGRRVYMAEWWETLRARTQDERFR